MESLLTPEEACQILGIRAGTLKNWVSEHRIAVVKVGRLNRFKRYHLEQFINTNTVPADSEENKSVL